MTMKILILDIETSPHLSFHWGRWQQNIQPEFTVSESKILCWAAKWHGKKQVIFRADHQDNMLSKLWELLDEADVVVGYNSNSFDLKRINREFLINDYDPPSPYAKVDLLRQIKKHFGFSSNKLKHVLKELGLTPKIEDNVNIGLWKGWLDGVPEAYKLMRRYNIQDVKSTDQLYSTLLGWMDGLPNAGLWADDVSDPEKPVCPSCGSRSMQKHKVRRTKTQVYQQWQCNACGAYHRGRRSLQRTGEGVLV